MVNKNILFSILFIGAVLVLVDCKRFGSSRGGSRSSGSSSRGSSSSYGSKHSYPSSHGGLSGSSGSHSYPSSRWGSGSSGSSLSGSSGTHSYPPSRGNSGSHTYPTSSGISGTNSGSSGSHSYPPSRGGSGSNSRTPGSHTYPISSGISGTNSGSSGTHSYPPSRGGSGSNSQTPGLHTYPTSSGISGTNSGSSWTHSYPPSRGVSGSNSQNPGSHTYPTSIGISGTNKQTSKPPSIGSSVIISVCWVTGAGVGFLPLFGWHAATDPNPDCYFVEVMDYNFLLFLYLATIITPSILLAGFYAHIYRVVVKQMSEVMTVEGGHGRVTGGTMLRVLGAAQKREVKATQNLAIIVFFFIICWIPLYTINAIKAFMPDSNIPNTLTDFCIILSHLNSAINPILYAYHLKDFRAALKGLICSMFGQGVPLPAAYRPPAPMRRTALERCNALRERPKIYVNSPIWLRQKQAELAVADERNRAVATSTPVVPDVEPFLTANVATEGSSSGHHTPELRESENGPYLIDSNQERCQSPYKRVEELLRRVRSVSANHS